MWRNGLPMFLRGSHRTPSLDVLITEVQVKTDRRFLLPFSLVSSRLLIQATLFAWITSQHLGPLCSSPSTPSAFRFLRLLLIVVKSSFSTTIVAERVIYCLGLFAVLSEWGCCIDEPAFHFCKARKRYLCCLCHLFLPLLLCGFFL